METEPKPSTRSPLALWVVGALTVVGGLIARSAMLQNARETYQTALMYEDMMGLDADVTLNRADADAALWVVAIGIGILLVALNVTMTRR